MVGGQNEWGEPASQPAAVAAAVTQPWMNVVPHSGLVTNIAMMCWKVLLCCCCCCRLSFWPSFWFTYDAFYYRGGITFTIITRITDRHPKEWHFPCLKTTSTAALLLWSILCVFVLLSSQLWARNNNHFNSSEASYFSPSCSPAAFLVLGGS